MGFISANHAQILHNNALINFHTLEAAHSNGVKRYLYTSSACVYPEYRQMDADVAPLKEEDAYPLNPRTPMAGRNYSPSDSASTTAKTMGSKRTLCVSIISLVRWERGMGEGEKPPQHCVARWPLRS
jgi:NAD dependent epimerase/dehydratase family